MKPRFVHISTGLAMLVAVLSCGGSDGLAPSGSDTGAKVPASDATLLAGLTASGPVANASMGANRSSVNASVGPSEEVSWVSLIPGTVVDGMTATIVNRRTAQGLTTAIVDGGFDPQPISASVGDTIQVTVSRVDKPDVGALLSVVPRPAPRLVRSRPMRGQTDAPLNTIITLVFSEPLDAASVNPTSITLTTDGSPVAGTVRVVPGPGYAVEFAPNALLAASTTYTLTVSGVVNLAGTPLAAPTYIPFTTSVPPTSAPPSTAIAPGGQAAREIRVNTHFYAHGIIESYTGNALATAWRSTDPSIATVEPSGNSRLGYVAGIRPGTTIVEGTAKGATATIAVTVLAPAPASAVSPVVVDYRMLELHNHNAEVDFWQYAPQLVLRDTTGRGGTAVIAVDIGLPGSSAAAQSCHMLRPVESSPTEVFHPYYLFYELTIDGANGARVIGTESVATITLRIPGPAAMMIEVRGPVVPGSYLTTASDFDTPWLSCE